MILEFLVFALGFLVAGLLALSALPAVWRRALRLTDERLSRLVPLSAEEVSAERDHLRALHAVELRRTELKLERAEADRAALRIEAARREQRILALDAEGARAQVAIAAFQAEIADLRCDVHALWAENGAEAVALHGLSTLAETRLRDIAGLQAERTVLEAERDRLEQELNRSRSRVAGLETRLVGAETQAEDVARNAARDLERGLADTRREIAEAAARDASHLREIESLRTELAFMAEQAASAERRASEAEKARVSHQTDASRSVAAAPVGPASGADEDGRLRAAVAALAEDILRVRTPV